MSIVCAHRDDEVLGLGGTIAKHMDVGHKVYAVSMSDGVGARGDNFSNEIESRNNAAKLAANSLRFEWRRMLDPKDYPQAFIVYGEYKLEFKSAKILE